MKKNLIFIVILFLSYSSFAQKGRDYLLTLETNKGTMHFVLFDDTPLHKANFLKLTKEKFFDGLLFHRVMKNFMIQGGDPNSRNAEEGKMLGAGDPNAERIPYEFTPKHVHFRGALAAARDGNPKKASSPSQFYFVQGKKIKPEHLVFPKDINTELKRENLEYTQEQKDTYAKMGGTPFLDNNYTVFGTAIDNFELIEEITKVETDHRDRPLEDVTMKITAKKMRKKKISKKFGYSYL